MRVALLATVAICLSLSGCATIKHWFAPSTPAAEPELPPERARRAAPPPTPPPSTPARAVPPRPAAPAPPPAPAPAPLPVPADTPPPVLSPVLSAPDEQKLRAEAQQRIDGAEQRLRQVDPAKLASVQQDSLQTVQSFLDKAREALRTQDVQRAFILADKAYLLADDLVRRPR